MPTNADAVDLLVDTSVAVPFVVEDHGHHRSVFARLEGRRIGLAGHAAFETYSVLTRLPGPMRRSPLGAREIMRVGFPASRFLSAAAERNLLDRLSELGIAGGSVYDALVAATAVEHGAVLATRDRRALDTYRALGVDLELIGNNP